MDGIVQGLRNVRFALEYVGKLLFSLILALTAAIDLLPLVLPGQWSSKGQVKTDAKSVLSSVACI